MKTQWRRFAVAGLYLAAIAALATIAYYIVQKRIDLYLQIGIAVIVLGLALYVFMDPSRARETFTGKQARYGNNILVMALAFAGILIAVNYLAFNNSKRWDLTEDKQHSLTDVTLETLSSLKTPVHAEAFFTPRFASEDARKLLESFKYNSVGKFDYQFIDPDSDPIAANEAKITRDGVIVLKMDNRQEEVTYASEQDITSAIIRLANPGKRPVYFLTGHGEYDPKGTGDTAYNQVRVALENKNYTVNTLNLISTPSIPDDALAVIVAGPHKPLTTQETNLLSAYLDKGGSLVVLVEPSPLTNFNNAVDPLAQYLSSKWGITLTDDIIVDPDVNPPLVAVANKYAEHPITQKMSGMVTLFPRARSLQKESTLPEGVNLVSLIETSSKSWGETDFAALKNNQVTADASKDHLGPLTVAFAGNRTQDKARVVVIGDSEFADESNFQSYGNGTFLINSIDWACEQENLINLTPKTPIQRVMLPPQTYVLGLILLVSVFVLPGLVIVAGVSAWLQRRKKG